MKIWASEIKEILNLYESIKGQLPDLERELNQLIITEDENVAMLYSRRCLEVIITDLCECELKRPRKTEPLKGIIDKLHSEEKVPSHIITSMHGLNSLSTYGVHPKDFDTEQVKPALSNLSIILKWYLKYKDSQTIAKLRVEEEIKTIQPDIPIIIRHKSKKAQYILLTAIILIILVMAAILFYPKIFKQDRLDYLRAKDKISIVVMPFRNMTNDTTMNYLREVIQYNLLTTLSYFPDALIVRQTESIDYLIQSRGLTNDASFKPTIASSISQKLDANIFIYGSIGQVGTTIRINAQLIDSKTGEIYKTIPKEVSSKEELNYQIIDALSKQVKDFLIISILKKDLYSGIQKFASTDSLNAYNSFINGQKAFNKGGYRTAIGHYLNALDIDSNFVTAAIMLTLAYSNQGQREDSKDLCDQAKYWCDKAYIKRDQMSEHQKILTNWVHAIIYDSPSARIKYLNQLLESDDQLPSFIYNLGLTYRMLSQHERAISEFKKALEMYKKWGVKPERIAYVIQLGREYHETGQYKKEKKLYKNAEYDFPDNLTLIERQAILSLTEGESIEANRYIEKWISIMKENLSSEAEVDEGLGVIYAGAGILDKAENYYRLALKSEPESHMRMNNLAWFLIDNDTDINEGLKYVKKALELSPDNHFYLDCKGWGLYKQGNYQEALNVLQKSWNLRPLYRHAVYLHLEAAKKAVDTQK